MPPPTSPGNPEQPESLADRLVRHVDVLAGLIGPRHLDRPEAFAAAAGYAERKLGRFGDRVQHESYRVDDAEVSNVFIERRGTTAADQVVLARATLGVVGGGARLAGSHWRLGKPPLCLAVLPIARMAEPGHG